MQRLRSFLAPGGDFRADVARYTRFDAALAVLLFAVYTLLLVPVFAYPDYFWAGMMLKLFFAPLAVYLIAYLRRQCIASLGIRWVGLGRSLIIALGACAVAVPLSALLAFAFGQRFQAPTVEQALLSLLWLLLTTGIPEELVCRGFVGKRLYGGMQNKALALLLGGVFFAVWHLPSLAGDYGGSWLAAAAGSWPLMVTCIVMHIVNMLLYAKTNNLAAPILLHTLWNLTQHAFQ